MKKHSDEQLHREQINNFFSTYSLDWRYIKILSNRKLLDSKYDFFNSIDSELVEINETQIADEISNGLLFDTIQQTIQFIEDLFALINAGIQKEYFIRSIVMYSAGKIENFIKNFDLTHSNLCNSFYFPDYQISSNDSSNETLNKIYECLEELKILVTEITSFYKSNVFFYNQYKHGLSIALKPLKASDKEVIEKDKNGELERSPLIAFESVNFQGALSKKNGNMGALVIPISDSIQQNIKKLEKENNLLRYVFSTPDCSIDRLVTIAEKTRICMLIFISNILESVSGKGVLKLQLPTSRIGERLEFDIEIENN